MWKFTYMYALELSGVAYDESTILIFTARSRYVIARYAMALCPCPPVFCHRSEFYRNGWTNRAAFGVRASFHNILLLQGNSDASKNMVTVIWNFVPNTELEIWPRQVESVVQKNLSTVKLVDGRRVVDGWP